jgi:hypothetical protein
MHISSIKLPTPPRYKLAYFLATKKVDEKIYKYFSWNVAMAVDMQRTFMVNWQLPSHAKAKVHRRNPDGRKGETGEIS